VQLDALQTFVALVTLVELDQILAQKNYGLRRLALAMTWLSRQLALTLDLIERTESTSKMVEELVK